MRVVAAGPRMALYREAGQRRIAAAARVRRRRALAPAAPRPPLRRRAHRVVPVLLAARRRRCCGRCAASGSSSTGTSCGSRDVLARVPRRRSAGASAGRCRRSACACRQRAFCFARLTAARLRAEGVRGEVDGARGRVRRAARRRRAPLPAEPVVVFAGRHIPEKRAPAVVPAVARARARGCPELRGADPRRRPGARRRCSRRSPSTALDGRRRGARLRRHRGGRARPRRARCACVLPSRREGYGLVVVEAAARGTPSVVVRGDRTTRRPSWSRRASTASSRASRRARGRSPTRSCACTRRGGELRASTADWFARNAQRLSLDASLDARRRELRAPRSARS